MLYLQHREERIQGFHLTDGLSLPCELHDRLAQTHVSDLLILFYFIGMVKQNLIFLLKQEIEKQTHRHTEEL